MGRVYTVKMRLQMTDELQGYLSSYITFYNSIQRRVFQDLKHGIPQDLGMSYYISYICSAYGILKRTANSIRYDMQGRIKAHLELKKTEQKELQAKLSALDKKIQKLEKEACKLKSLAACNELTEDELVGYRNLKTSLYHKKNRRNCYAQKLDSLSWQIKRKDVSLCFGTKKMLDKQNRLPENGYRSHGQWLRDFRGKRDCGICFLGSGDESFGNQVLQLRPAGDGSFTMVLFRDKPYRDGHLKQVILLGIRFPYMQAELESAIQNHKPVTYRILRKGRRWYLAAMFAMDTLVTTGKSGGVIGADYNDGFIECVETDVSGNMASAWHTALQYHGAGNKAESELKGAVSSLVRHARDIGKDIVVEDLDFRKKKAGQLKGGNTQYNRMLHAFDYHRYLFWLENLCAKYGVGFHKVDPAYTSKIGKQKYAGSRKLTVHRAAAWVIARREQGFHDKLIA